MRATIDMSQAGFSFWLNDTLIFVREALKFFFLKRGAEEECDREGKSGPGPHVRDSIAEGSTAKDPHEGVGGMLRPYGHVFGTPCTRHLNRGQGK